MQFTNRVGQNHLQSKIWTLSRHFLTKTDDFSLIWARNEGPEVQLGTWMKKN